MTSIEQQFVSVNQATIFSGLSEVTIRRAIKQGNLAAYKIGGRSRPTLRICLDSLSQWVTGNPVARPIVAPRPRRKRGEDWRKYFGIK